MVSRKKVIRRKNISAGMSKYFQGQRNLFQYEERSMLTIGFVNPTPWIHLGAGGEFTQPMVHLLAYPCSFQGFSSSHPPPYRTTHHCRDWLQATSYFIFSISCRLRIGAGASSSSISDAAVSTNQCSLFLVIFPLVSQREMQEEVTDGRL